MITDPAPREAGPREVAQLRVWALADDVQSLTLFWDGTTRNSSAGGLEVLGRRLIIFPTTE